MHRWNFKSKFYNTSYVMLEKYIIIFYHYFDRLGYLIIN
jgi:hypothetical protein